MLQVIIDKQCSKCLVVNKYETLNRNNEYIIKCKQCGHEKNNFSNDNFNN